MTKRALLGILLLGLVTASLLAVSGDATASHVERFVLRPNEYIENDAGLPENWGRDTVLTEEAPSTNHKNEQFLNTSAVEDRNSEIVLRFPLDQPMRVNLSDSQKEPTDPLPPNVSVSETGATGATLRIFYLDAMDDDQKERDLDVHRLLKPWEEGELTWDGARERNNFVAQSPIATSPAQEALQQPGFRQWDVTPYISDVLSPLNPSSFFGFLVRDAEPDDGDCGQPTIDCVQEFYSSNWLTDGGDPDGCDARPRADGGCIPELVVDARLNEPQAQNITYEGGFDGEYVAPDVPLNVSVDVWDPAGEIEDILLDVHHEDGDLMFREDLAGNRSRNLTGDRPDDIPTTFKTWRNGSLDLDPGEYTFNLSIRDSDDRWFRTDYETPNLTVEATPPNLADVEVGPAEIEGEDTVSFSFRTNDTRGINATWVVLNHTDRRPIRTDDLDPQGDVDDDGNGTYAGTHTFQFPGTYNVSLRSQDRPGNVASARPCDVNASAPCTIKVVDLEDPTILESCIVGESRCRSDLQGQEIGGDLTFRLRATDNHPRDPDVQLLVTPPTGPNRTLEADKVGPNRWEETISFDSQAQWPAGEYEARWIVEDPDGNTRQTRSPLPFLVEPAGPPRLVEVTPEHEGWGGAEPTVTATVRDVNIDPDRIDVDVSVNGGPFEGVQTSIGSSTTEAFVSAELGPFVHGDEIRVRVNATDTFGRFPDPLPVWTFTVDDRDPQAELDLDGEALEGLARRIVPSSTSLVFDGSDGNESGLDRVEYRLSPRDGASSDWRPAEGPVNVTRHPAYEGSGPYTVEYRAVDVAGNVGSSTSVDLYVDTVAPTVSFDRQPGRLELTVGDPGAGVEDVQVFYRNGSNPFRELPVELLQQTAEGGIYGVDLPMAPRGTSIQVYFAATDALGHTRTVGEPDTAGVRPIRWAEPNHPPEVSLTGPTAGSTLSGNVPVTWEASDPEDDEYGIQVSARPTPLDGFREVEDPAGDPGRVEWDTTAFPDGRYVLRVTADDGRNTTHATTQVDVRNTETGLAGVDIPSDIEPGDETPLAVTIYQDVAAVEATVTVTDADGTRTAATVPLRDDGQGPDENPDDATFTGSFVPDEEGTYSVSLGITYGDGSSEDVQGVSTFTAQTTLAEQIQANQDLVAALGAILVVLTAGLVVQLYRYGYI